MDSRATINNGVYLVTITKEPVAPRYECICKRTDGIHSTTCQHYNWCVPQTERMKK